MMGDMVYWIWLSLSVTPGAETFRKLIDKFNTAKSIYDADEVDISSVIGSTSRDFLALANKDLAEAERVLNFCTEKSVGILTYDDEKYPNKLKEINTPPVLLYYRGKLPEFNSEFFVSMVGTRRLTDYGRRNAYVIGYDLATAGAIVVSGMAVGIDGVSHAGALAAGGTCVAFIGSGIDVCYPEIHKRLAREIVKNGCVMTEYAPGTKPLGYHFPKRNRLIAALSAATIVVEGSIDSGAIITARHAKEYGRAVYALPGNVDNVTSGASNVLIKNGAKILRSAVDIIEDYEYIYHGKIFLGKIKMKPDVPMNKALSDFEISCVCPSDDIFRPSSSKRKTVSEKSDDSKLTAPVNTETVAEPLGEYTAIVENLNFDKDTLCIYRKIPSQGDCSINDLVDSNDKMNIVMKALLKLEMGKFVVLLPGERVKRNLK